MNNLFSDVPAKAPEYDLTSLLEAGCHFGHASSKWNPRIAEYIYTERDGVHIFDLAQTAAQLQKAYDVLFDMGKNKKQVLVVATKRQAKQVVAEAVEGTGLHLITSRWLGGFLTNWEQVSKSIAKMNSLEKGLATGKYDKYTKYERVQLEKELNKLRRFFKGVAKLESKPDCVIVVDAKREAIAVAEARTSGVPLIGIVDSNTDPHVLDLPIPANDDAVRSIEFIITELAGAYAAGAKAVK